MRTDKFIVGKPPLVARRTEEVSSIDLTTLDATTATLDVAGFEEVSFHLLQDGGTPGVARILFELSVDDANWVSGETPVQPEIDGLYTYPTFGFPYARLRTTVLAGAANDAQPIVWYLSSTIARLPEESRASGLTNGGLITHSTGSLTCTAGTGFIVDAHNAPSLPFGARIIFEAQTITPTLTGGATAALILIDTDGVLGYSQSITDFTLFRTTIILGVAKANASTGAIEAVYPRHSVAGSLSGCMYDLNYSQISKVGVVLEPNSATMTADLLAGRLIGLGINWETDRSDPNVVDIGSQSSLTFDYIDAAGAVEASAQTDFDATRIDTNGAGTLNTLTSGYFSIQRVFARTDQTVFAVYGQQEYATLLDAFYNIDLDLRQALLPDWLEQTCVLVGSLIMKDSATDLTTITDAVVVNGTEGPFTSVRPR